MSDYKLALGLLIVVIAIVSFMFSVFSDDDSEDEE